MSDKQENRLPSFDNMPPDEMLKWADSIMVSGGDWWKFSVEKKLKLRITWLEQPTDYVPEGWTQAEYRAALDSRALKLRAELERLETFAVKRGLPDARQAEIKENHVPEYDELSRHLAGYVPYGWRVQDWLAHLTKEEAQKTVAWVREFLLGESPVNEKKRGAVHADGTPDFDNMTPEEMMTWMESIAYG